MSARVGPCWASPRVCRLCWPSVGMLVYVLAFCWYVGPRFGLLFARVGLAGCLLLPVLAHVRLRWVHGKRRDSRESGWVLAACWPLLALAVPFCVWRRWPCWQNVRGPIGFPPPTHIHEHIFCLGGGRFYLEKTVDQDCTSHDNEFLVWRFSK